MNLKTVISSVMGWSVAALLVWLVMMAASGLLLVFVPSSLKLTERFICSEGATVEVLRVLPQAGKGSVYVDCVEADGTRHTGQQLRAVATMATLLFVPAFLLLLTWPRSRNKEQLSLPEAPMPPVDAALDAEVRRLVEQGQVIQAIKRVRNATGMSLKQAKEYVESQPPRSERLAHSLSHAAQPPADGPGPVETLRQLKELLDAGLITPEDYEGKKAEVLSRM